MTLLPSPFLWLECRSAGGLPLGLGWNEDKQEKKGGEPVTEKEVTNLKDAFLSGEDSQGFPHRAAFNLNYFQPTARLVFIQDGSVPRMAHGNVCAAEGLNCLRKPNGQPRALETCP